MKIISCCVTCVLLIAAALYFIPWPTPVNLTLTAVKLDADGNEIGTFPVTIKGVKKNYLFQEDVLDVSISPFDGYVWFKPSEDAPSGKEGVISKYFDECMQVTYGTAHPEYENMVFAHLRFTEDFKYITFEFYIPEENERVYYIASADENCTTQEVKEYFRTLVPGYQLF